MMKNYWSSFIQDKLNSKRAPWFAGKGTMDDVEINRVMELEHGLWLASIDGSDVPRLVFYDPGTELPTPLGRSLQDVVNGVQAQPQRSRWHKLITGWLESHTVLFAADDLRLKVAEKAATILK